LATAENFQHNRVPQSHSSSVKENPSVKRFALLAVLIGIATLSSLSPVALASDKEQKAVLITGASTGIGRAAAEQLAAAGYFVYAGARKDADMADLDKIDNVKAVRIDVTKQEQIDAAVKLIEQEGRGLWGLVNNAGVNVVAPLIEADESDFKFLFNVNVFGVYRVTKAFAPLIIESKGRIVNISSISGVLSGGGYGMYAASKHAVEAMTDALAGELEDFDVFVTAVNPGNFASEIGLTRCKRLLGDAGADDWGLFEDRRQGMITDCKERLKAGVEEEGASPVAVAKVIEQALFEENPRDRYLIVPRQVEAGWTIARSVEELLIFNVGHEHSYTRDELVELIDAMWPFASGEKSWDNEEQEAAMMQFMEGWMNRGGAGEN
jgi:NAD(P)-dependent dehydrogenase (short-subunit alcohol dehydrogenase family)